MSAKGIASGVYSEVEHWKTQIRAQIQQNLQSHSSKPSGHVRTTSEKTQEHWLQRIKDDAAALHKKQQKQHNRRLSADDLAAIHLLALSKEGDLEIEAGDLSDLEVPVSHSDTCLVQQSSEARKGGYHLTLAADVNGFVQQNLPVAVATSALLLNGQDKSYSSLSGSHSPIEKEQVPRSWHCCCWK